MAIGPQRERYEEAMRAGNPDWTPDPQREARDQRTVEANARMYEDTDWQSTFEGRGNAVDIDMGSRDVRHDPNQLKLFYSAGELRDTINESGDRMYLSTGLRGGGRESLEAMWERKVEESKKPANTGHGSGVYESIEKQGYQEQEPTETDSWGRAMGVGSEPPGIPVRWDNDQMQVMDAHHRIAAAADIEKKTGKTIWMNVSHIDPKMKRKMQIEEAERKGRRQM